MPVLPCHCHTSLAYFIIRYHLVFIFSEFQIACSSQLAAHSLQLIACSPLRRAQKNIYHVRILKRYTQINAI